MSSKSVYPRQSYDIISIYQNGGRQPYWISCGLYYTTREVQLWVPTWSTFEVNRIHNFGDIAIFRFRRFTLELPIYVVISAAHAQNQGSIYFHGENYPHIWICGSICLVNIKFQ